MRDTDDSEVTFDALLRVTDLMRAFPSPWWVAGGWAIDLFVGRTTRKHSDIEIGIFRQDQRLARDLFQNWHPETAEDDWRPWLEGEHLGLPLHQVRFTSPEDGLQFELFLNERTDAHWRSRRHEGLSCPIDDLTFISNLGPPALQPQIQLLFKAKYARAKDDHDLETALPQMSPPQRNWLTESLRRFHPGHAWLAKTTAGNPPE